MESINDDGGLGVASLSICSSNLPALLGVLPLLALLLKLRGRRLLLLLKLFTPLVLTGDKATLLGETVTDGARTWRSHLRLEGVAAPRGRCWSILCCWFAALVPYMGAESSERVVSRDPRLDERRWSCAGNELMTGFSVLFRPPRSLYRSKR